MVTIGRLMLREISRLSRATQTTMTRPAQRMWARISAITLSMALAEIARRITARGAPSS